MDTYRTWVRISGPQFAQANESTISSGDLSYPFHQAVAPWADRVVRRARTADLPAQRPSSASARPGHHGLTEHLLAMVASTRRSYVPCGAVPSNRGTLVFHWCCPDGYKRTRQNQDRPNYAYISNYYRWIDFGQPLIGVFPRFSAAAADPRAVTGRTPSNRFTSANALVSTTCCAPQSLLRLQAGQSIHGLPARRDEAPPALRLFPARPSAARMRSFGPFALSPRRLDAQTRKTRRVFRVTIKLEKFAEFFE